MTQLAYFAKDGNYGDADGITVIDVTKWEADDFDLIDQASDEHRPLAARLVAEWIEKGRTEEHDEFFERLGIDKTSR